MNPVVSIIMPCFNAVSQLPMSVNSVLSQTFKDWELIIVDDGSSDGTLVWLSAQKDSRIRVYSQENRGVSSARNMGIRVVRGEYVAFLDADDTWEPMFIDVLYSALRAQPDAVLVYCGWENIGLTGDRGKPFIPPDYEQASKRENLFSGCRWPIHAALTRYDAIMSTGGFDEDLNNAEDFLLWLEVAGTSPIVRVPEVLAYYHFHGDMQATSNHAFAALQLVKAQLIYLDKYPDFAIKMDVKRRRDLLYGNLLIKGYEYYWKSDLFAAHVIFRHVMKARYGRFRDWKYTFPTMLPFNCYRTLVDIKRRLSRRISLLK